MHTKFTNIKGFTAVAFSIQTKGMLLYTFKSFENREPGAMQSQNLVVSYVPLKIRMVVKFKVRLNCLS